MLECEQNVNAFNSEFSDSLFVSLLEICEEYKSNIANLQEELTKKNQLVTELSERMKPLIERNTISKQKDLFVDWFERCTLLRN